MKRYITQLRLVPPVSLLLAEVKKNGGRMIAQMQDAVTDCFTTYGNHVGVLQMAMYMSVTNSLEKNSEGVADEQ